MTLVCCWLDQSSSLERITSVADARVSYQDDTGNKVVLNETTLKLSPITISCHELNLSLFTSQLEDPYYSTEIGVGFAGFLNEAYSIIALLRRCCGQLVTEGPGRPKPSVEGLARMTAALCDRFFEKHSRPKEQDVQLLLFGYDERGRPWALTLKHKHGAKTSYQKFEPLTVDDFVRIGDGANTAPINAVTALRSAISRHARKSKARVEDGDQEIHEARHKTAEKEGIEDKALELAESKFMESVGGVLQKLELFWNPPQNAVAAYTHDRKAHILEGLPAIGPELGYAPMTERMGRGIMRGSKGTQT